MSRTDPTALTGALLAQRSLTRRAVQGASPAVFRVEAPATATVGAWLGLAYSHVRMPLGRKVEAEDLPAFVAIVAQVPWRLGIPISLRYLRTVRADSEYIS